VLVNKQPTAPARGIDPKNIGVDIAAPIASGAFRTANKKGTAAASDVGVLGIAGTAWAGAGSVADGRRIWLLLVMSLSTHRIKIPLIVFPLALGVAPPSSLPGFSAPETVFEPEAWTGDERKKSGDCVEVSCSLEFLGVACGPRWEA
jgi:hypothetical protein